MATTLTETQSLMASGLGACTGEWSVEAVPTFGYKTKTAYETAAPAYAWSAIVRKHRNAISGRPQEGSS